MTPHSSRNVCCLANTLVPTGGKSNEATMLVGPKDDTQL